MPAHYVIISTLILSHYYFIPSDFFHILLPGVKLSVKISDHYKITTVTTVC